MVVYLVLKHCWWTAHWTAMQALHRSIVCLMDTESPCVSPLSQPLRGLPALPSLTCWGLIINFGVYFSFNGAPSTIKDGCQKNVKCTFLTSHPVFCRISHHKAFFLWLIPCRNIFFPLNIFFCFFEQCSSVSTNYKQTVTQAKPAQKYSKISTSLILGWN